MLHIRMYVPTWPYETRVDEPIVCSCVSEASR